MNLSIGAGAKGSGLLAPPWDELRRYRAKWWQRGLPNNWRYLWLQRQRYLQRHLSLIVERCAEHNQGAMTHIEAAWIAALLWDELARRDLTESISDALLGELGRDPSVGPYQVTGVTAAQVVAFMPWGGPWSAHGLAELRARLLDIDFATRIVIGRSCQILTTWQQAGHDPFALGGLGPHRLAPIELLGTLYSQGLGSPKAAPRANARGQQIGRFAEQAQELLDELEGQKVPESGNC